MRPASCRCDARSNVDAFTRCRSRDQRLFYARNEAFALPKIDGVPIQKMFRPDDCIFVVGTDECAETYDVSVLANRTSSVPVHTAFLPISSVPVCLLPNMPAGISALAVVRPDASDLRAETSSMIEGGTVPLGRRADYAAPACDHKYPCVGAPWNVLSIVTFALLGPGAPSQKSSACKARARYLPG